MINNFKMSKFILITSGKGGVGKSLAYLEYISLANGDIIQIGPYTDKLFEDNKPKIKQLIVNTNKGEEIFEVLEPPQNLILDIVNENPLASEKKRPIAIMRKPAPSSLMRIKTSNGKIEVTEEHKFLTIRNGALIKVRADELTTNDYLLEFNYPKFNIEYENSSEEIAKLLGYLTGDGYFEKRGNNFIVHVFCEEKNKSLIEKSFKNVFGDFKILKDKRTGVIRISYFKTSVIMNLFSEYGVTPATSGYKEIPKRIIRSNNHICASFLSALFDSDGYVSKNRNEIDFDTKSEKLALQVGNILRSRFKIESQLSEGYKKASNSKGEKHKYFRLVISGEDILSFYSRLGFNVTHKQERLKEKVDFVKFNTNIKVFPVGKLIKLIRDSSNIKANELAKILGVSKQMVYEYEWGLYALSKNSLKDFIQAFKELKISDEKIEFLENLLNKGYSFRKISKVERVDYKYPFVYDFQVCDEGGHFTHSTGIVISNTTTAVNLATAMNYFDEDVTLVDVNLTTPNIGLHLGAPVVPVTLNHVLSGKADLVDAIYEHESGTKVIPSSLSLRELKQLDEKDLMDISKDLRKISDTVILDSAAGLGPEALSALSIADEVIIVTNPEMPAVTDALKTAKVAEDMGKEVIGVIINRVKGNKSEMSLQSIKEMLELPILGIVPEDDKIQEALSMRNAVIMTHPRSKAARSYRAIAGKILGKEVIENDSLFERVMINLGFR